MTGAGDWPLQIPTASGGERAAHVVVITIELRIPTSGSLKAKRRVVKGFKDRVRARLNAAVAETGYLEQWQRTLLGVAMIGANHVHIEQGINALEQLARETPDAELLAFNVEWL